MLPVLAGAAAGAVGRVALGAVAGAARAVGTGIAAGGRAAVAGAGRAVAGAGRIAGTGLMAMGAGGGGGGSGRGGSSQAGGGTNLPAVQNATVPDEITVAPDADFERVVEEQGTGNAAADQLLDTLDRIDVNTAQTAAGVERLVDAQEDAPLEGPTDTPNDPNDGSGGDGGGRDKTTGGMFAGILKMLKGFLNKFVMFFAAAGLVVGGILSGGAGDLFEKLKSAFDRLVEALAPILQVLMETVMPPLFDLFGSLVDIFVKVVEILAPIVTNLIETIFPPLAETFTLLVTLFGNIIEMLSPVLVVVGEILGEVISAILTLINGVLTFFTDPIGYLKDGLSYLADGGDMILAGLGDFINGIIEFIADLVSNIPMVGDSAAAALRDMKVEFGDRARERMATREQERADRAAAREAEEAPQPEEPQAQDQQTQPAETEAPVQQQTTEQTIADAVKVSLEDQQRLTESQQQTTAAQRTSTQAGPDVQVVEQQAEKVDPKNEILTQLSTMDPQAPSAGTSITVKTKDGGRATLKPTMFDGFTEQEVISAVTSLPNVSYSPSAKTFQGTDGSAMQSETLMSNIEANLSTPSDMVETATAQTAQAAEQAATVGGGTNISAPMVAQNTQNIQNHTSTGIIYTGEGDSLGHRVKVLPGVA